MTDPHTAALLQAQSSALLSLFDVVNELAHEVGDPDWAAVVTDTFNGHRRELADPTYRLPSTR